MCPLFRGKTNIYISTYINIDAFCYIIAIPGTVIRTYNRIWPTVWTISIILNGNIIQSMICCFELPSNINICSIIICKSYNWVANIIPCWAASITWNPLLYTGSIVFDGGNFIITSFLVSIIIPLQWSYPEKVDT